MQMLLRDPMRLMREFFTNPFGMLMSPGMWNPSFEVRETDDAFVVKGDLPGLRTEDVDITLTGNRIEIRGKRDVENETTEGTLHTYERSYGDFRRSFVVPEIADVDQLRCDLKDGVLTMVVPKKQGAAQQSRKIQIGSGSKSSMPWRSRVAPTVAASRPSRSGSSAEIPRQASTASTGSHGG